VRIRLTRAAGRDISGILRTTRKIFGPKQVVRYTEIIEKALQMVAEKPDRPSSQERLDLGPGVRSFHLQFSTGRNKGAAHILYYRAAEDTGEVTIFRILGDAMEPKTRVANAIRKNTSSPRKEF
jgi:toxin ParE1/3/4